VLRIARENGLDSHYGGSGALSGEGGFGLDSLDQGRDTSPIDLRRQMGPTGDGGEGDGFQGGVSQPAEVLVAETGGELLSAVEPMACH
jgi:hypothetical protein